VKVLLVGGKGDGKRVDVNGPLPPEYRVAVYPDVVPSFQIDASLASDTDYLQIDEYEVMHLCGSYRGLTHEFTVYGVRGLNPIDLIAMLIDGYRS